MKIKARASGPAAGVSVRTICSNQAIYGIQAGQKPGCGAEAPTPQWLGANHAPAGLETLFATIQEMASATRDALGEERLAMAERLAADSDAGSDGAGACQSRKPLAFTRAYGMIVANTGSVGLPYDGGCGFPHADWIAEILESTCPLMP